MPAYTGGVGGSPYPAPAGMLPAPGGVGGPTQGQIVGQNLAAGWRPDPNTPGHFIQSGAQHGAEAGQALTGLQHNLSPELQSLLFGADTMSMTGAGGAGGAGGHQPNVAPMDNSAAVNQAFARAKDNIGLQARGALTGLSNAMAARGITGGGLMSRGIRDVVQNSDNNLANVTSQGAMESVNNARADAAANYQGGITQRGQDVTAEGQRLAYNQNMLMQRRQSIQGLLTSLGASGGGLY